jgi:hypothetical protein
VEGGRERQIWTPLVWTPVIDVDCSKSRPAQPETEMEYLADGELANIGRHYGDRTFVQKYIPNSVQIFGRQTSNEKRSEPMTNSCQKCGNRGARNNVYHRRHTAAGGRPISTYNFLQTAESLPSTALLKRAASTSICMALDEKYGRK